MQPAPFYRTVAIGQPNLASHEGLLYEAATNFKSYSGLERQRCSIRCRNFLLKIRPKPNIFNLVVTVNFAKS